MNRLDKVKKVIRENIKDANCGLFFTRNVVGDRMCTIYCEDNVTVDICYDWAYFEVLGLNSKEKEKLIESYYKYLKTEQK